MLRALIVVGVVTAGIERIDFLRGQGAVVLTPFFVLAPVLAVAAFSLYSRKSRSGEGRPMGVPLGLSLLVVAVVFSLVFSESEKSPQRAVLLFALMVGGLALVYLVRETRDYGALQLGAAIALGTYVLFDVIQFRTFTTYGLLGPEFSGYLNMKVGAYGSGFTRLMGGSLDANRAGVAVATYCFILLGDPVSSRVRSPSRSVFIVTVGLVLTLLTFSRSATVAFFLVLIGAIGAIYRQQTQGQRVVTSGLLVVILGYVFTSGAFGTSDIAGVFSSRLDLATDQSTGVHFDLYGRGFELLNSAGVWIHGEGYGSSYLFLQDYFYGNAYGNFHSLYMTALVEGGLLFLAAILMLLLPPLRGPRRWLAAGVIVFGIFYQGLSDPIFWLQIGLLWLLPDSIETDAAMTPERTPRTRERSAARPRLR